MVESKYDGKHVVYVDPLRLTHTGTIVGQSPDAKWLFVQSNNVRAPQADWHFKIAANQVDAFLQKSQ